MGHAVIEENGMAHACRGLRRAITVLCVSLALLVAASSGGAPVALAAGGGGASSCGNGPPATIPPTTSGGPTIALRYPTGPAGMMQTITGAGWQSGANVVLDLIATAQDGTYYIGQSSLASAAVQSDGSFAMASFLMPAVGECATGADTPPGTHAIFVVHTLHNTQAAKAVFTFTSMPTLDVSNQPGLATVGVPLPLSGVNWEPNELITLQVSASPPIPFQGGAAGKPLPVSNGTFTTHADGKGNLGTSYTPPDTLAPRSILYIQATGTGPLYGTITTPIIQMPVYPAVTPSITLSRSSGTVNDAITVRGANWYPGDTVTITYCRWQTILSDLQVLRCDPSQSQTLTAVTVDAAGHFSTSIHLPTSAQNGPITIQALVPNDVFGLAVYAQAAPYTIVPPPPPWSSVHPRQAFALSILKPALPALALALILLGVYLWRRRSRTARSTGVALPERDRFTRV